MPEVTPMQPSWDSNLGFLFSQFNDLFLNCSFLCFSHKS